MRFILVTSLLAVVVAGARDVAVERRSNYPSCTTYYGSSSLKSVPTQTTTRSATVTYTSVSYLTTCTTVTPPASTITTTVTPAPTTTTVTSAQAPGTITSTVTSTTISRLTLPPSRSTSSTTTTITITTTTTPTLTQSSRSDFLPVQSSLPGAGELRKRELQHAARVHARAMLDAGQKRASSKPQNPPVCKYASSVGCTSTTSKTSTTTVTKTGPACTKTAAKPTITSTAAASQQTITSTVFSTPASVTVTTTTVTTSVQTIAIGLLFTTTYTETSTESATAPTATVYTSQCQSDNFADEADGLYITNADVTPDATFFLATGTAQACCEACQVRPQCAASVFDRLSQGGSDCTLYLENDCSVAGQYSFTVYVASYQQTPIRDVSNGNCAFFTDFFAQ